MLMDEVFSHTFKAIRKQIEERKAAGRRLWQQRLGTASEFCQAVVSNGYLTEEQMQRAAQRYRLGASRDGGVIFWQIDEFDQLRDGKIMHYRPDCHRDLPGVHKACPCYDVAKDQNGEEPSQSLKTLPQIRDRPMPRGQKHA